MVIGVMFTNLAMGPTMYSERQSLSVSVKFCCEDYKAAQDTWAVERWWFFSREDSENLWWDVSAAVMYIICFAVMMCVLLFFTGGDFYFHFENYNPQIFWLTRSFWHFPVWIVQRLQEYMSRLESFNNSMFTLRLLPWFWYVSCVLGSGYMFFSCRN